MPESITATILSLIHIFPVGNKYHSFICRRTVKHISRRFQRHRWGGVAPVSYTHLIQAIEKDYMDLNEDGNEYVM